MNVETCIGSSDPNLNIGFINQLAQQSVTSIRCDWNSMQSFKGNFDDFVVIFFVCCMNRKPWLVAGAICYFIIVSSNQLRPDQRPNSLYRRTWRFSNKPWISPSPVLISSYTWSFNQKFAFFFKYLVTNANPQIYCLFQMTIPLPIS